MVCEIFLFKLIFLSDGPPLILLEAEDFKWWATLLMYYKLMFIQLTFIPLNSISQKGGPPLIPISVVHMVLPWWYAFIEVQCEIFYLLYYLAVVP